MYCRKQIWFFIILLTAGHVPAQYSPKKDIRIDSIHIEKNWISRTRIIMREVGFKKGDMVSRGMIDTAIHKIWNIGNFATVKYKLDTLPGNINLLRITAKDAFNIIPIFGPQGSGKDFNLDLGIMDGNFLGSNLKLMFKYKYGSNSKDILITFFIPRQLLYRNMTLDGGFMMGGAHYYRYIKKDIISGIGYRYKTAYINIGNPFREDYSFEFAPCLNLSWLRQKTDRSLIDNAFPMDDYEVNFFGLNVSESVGTINYKRHQKDGLSLSINGGINIGLDKTSKSTGNVGFTGEYDKLFNQWLQLTLSYTTGATSAELPSLINYLGAGSVKGILTGQISGRSYYTAYIGAHITYVNREWFAAEESFYINFGNGKDKYFDLYKTFPVYSVGTGFRIYSPMVPWMIILVYVSYSPVSNNWYYIGL